MTTATKSVIDLIIAQHDATKGNPAITHELPVGGIIEREAEDRWRCHVQAQEGYGHGVTLEEAVTNYFYRPGDDVPRP